MRAASPRAGAKTTLNGTDGRSAPCVRLSRAYAQSGARTAPALTGARPPALRAKQGPAARGSRRRDEPNGMERNAMEERKCRVGTDIRNLLSRKREGSSMGGALCQRSLPRTYADRRRKPPLPLAGEAGWGPASASAKAAAPGSRREARPQPLPPSGRGEKGQPPASMSPASSALVLCPNGPQDMSAAHGDHDKT